MSHTQHTHNPPCQSLIPEARRFFQTEQHPPDGGPEGGGDTGRCACVKDEKKLLKARNLFL